MQTRLCQLKWANMHIVRHLNLHLIRIKEALRLVCLSAAMFSGIGHASAGTVDVKSAFQQANKENAPLTTLTLALGHGLNVTASVQMTSKGNGTLSLPNLGLRLFDQHDDGLVYRGGLLKLDLVTLGDDRYASILVSGILQHTGEKESDPIEEEAAVFIYRLDCRSGKFVQTYRNSSINIEIATEKVAQIKCRY
jgi:hypothetical protein